MRTVAIATLVLLAGAAPASAATVVRVVDGDTVKVRDGGKTRSVDLAGVDAPEAGACQGAEAKRGLAKLLPAGATVKLQRDPQRRSDRALRAPPRQARQRGADPRGPRARRMRPG